MGKYWIQTLKGENWNKLKSEFKKEHLYIYSYNVINISIGDTIIIYYNESRTTDNGFVCYCKVSSIFELNTKKNICRRKYR